MSDPEQQVQFALASSADGGPNKLIFLIPAKAWEYIKDGKTNTFDLTKIGIPLQVIMAGCKDRAEARAIISTATAGTKTVGMHHIDFGIEPGPGPGKGH